MAVLILAIFTSSLYACFAYGFGVIQSSREDLRATQIAMQKLEGIRLCTWSQLTNCPFSFQDYYDPLGATNQTSGTLYVGTVSTGSATNIPDSASYKTNMCLVTVNLYWTNCIGGKPAAHSRQMQTQVARDGLQNYFWGTAP